MYCYGKACGDRMRGGRPKVEKRGSQGGGKWKNQEIYLRNIGVFA